MFFQTIDSLQSCKNQTEEAYFLLSLLGEKSLIQIGESYYFLKNDTISLTRHTPITSENIPIFEEHIRFAYQENICTRYKIYTDTTIRNNEKVIYQVEFSYENNHLCKEVLRYYDRIQRDEYYVDHWVCTNDAIQEFYELYTTFYKSKGLNTKSLPYFIRIIPEEKSAYSLLRVYSKTWKLVWSTLLFRFLDMIIIPYWWYQQEFIQRWWKYFVNKCIIDSFRNTPWIKRIAFWTGIQENDSQDSLLTFKTKFWHIYPLYLLEWCYWE